jgi:hypothetical protein
MGSASLSGPTSLKPYPRFETDEAAERFVETADLSEHDVTGFERARFEFEPEPKADVGP